jgi:separase
LKELAETVLSLYHERTHSLHRLRFITDMLIFCSKSQLNPTQFLPEEASRICMNASTNEAHLNEKHSSLSARSLHSSVLLQWSFQTSAPSENLLQNFVSSHTIAVELSDDWALILPCINDPPLVIVQVQSVIDFADMRGLSHIKLGGLLLMKRLLEVQPERDSSALASCTAQMGLEYTRMGLTSKAGRALASTESFLMQSESKALIALHWHLAYAEYLTALSSYEKAAEHLVSAQWRYEAGFLSEEHASGPRLAQYKCLAQAAYVASNLAFENGDHDTAVLHAKKSVRTSIRLWAVLEKLLRSKSSLATQEQSISRIDVLTEDLSNMTVSEEDQAKNASGKAAAFWSSVQMHFDGLLHLSRLSAHRGSFQDAVYYAEQAKKVGEATGSDVLLLKATYVLAAHLGQADRIDESQLIVDKGPSSCEYLDYSAGFLQAFVERLGLHLAKGDCSQAVEGVKQAQVAISKIQAADCPSSPSNLQKKDSSKAVPIKVSRSASRATRKARKPRFPQTNAVSPGVHAELINVTADHLKVAAGVSTWIQRLQVEVLLLKSRFCIQSGSYEDAGKVLETVTPLARSSTSETWYLVLQATVIMAYALRLLRSDAVYSVLAETTIAFPTQQRKFTDDLELEDIARGRAPSAFSTMPECANRQTTKQRACGRDDFLEPRELVEKASGLLLSVPSSRLSGCSSAVANELLRLLTQTQLLSSLLLPATSPSPLQISCHLNAPNCLRWSREVASIGADILLGKKSTTFGWPETYDFKDAASAYSRCVHDCKDLQQELINTLPPSWNVITIALSGDDSEILISKIRHCQSPFLLRLPLQRTTSEDFDEELLDFDAAKREMLDIIASANLTSHDAKGRSDKQGKKDWWTAREALDARLASLLNNIEALWLGGFRGILSDHYYDEQLLSRFSGSLSRVLDRQLPSRRKVATNEEPRFELHSHVLELFVALGNPDEGDLGDAITDLLYFVIDILQFQGERNAYDEIDFDSMVLEVIDALRSFHDAVKGVSLERGGHTILVLDKALHTIPWESLPCLEGQPVSRMPSLNCLQERILRMRQNGEANSGLSIDRRKGAYILNPSSDLTSTKETFIGSFESTLASFTSIVNRAPSETEFETCLRDKDLCLYFGHGSGAQYVRGRTVKRLKQCAVTFLMGCSSGKMVECGQFEPYGVPYDYMHAGSAAVVGTLWDVTDKDIDRFAMETFVRWGLLGRGAVKEETKPRVRKLRGNGRTAKQNADPDEKPAGERIRKAVGLDDAVAKARQACLLRFLNGAAPVIYGVPVYLD